MLKALQRGLVLSTFLRSPSRCEVCRSFSASVHKMDKLKDNPYFEKYAEKLKKKQEEDPEEFESKVNQVVESHKKKLEERKQAMEEEEKRLREEASQVKPGSLNSIMKVDLIKEKTPEEIEEIWTSHLKTKPCVFAVIPKEQYAEMRQKAREFGTFIYPIPRDQGYEFFLQQFAANTINFTPLIQFQAHKENAPTCLTITHYEELLEDKGIVLMHGEPDTKVLSVYEAQLLALQVKLYYGLQSGLKFNLVRILNTSPDSFRYMDLITHFENYKKDSLLAKEDRLSKEVD